MERVVQDFNQNDSMKHRRTQGSGDGLLEI